MTAPHFYWHGDSIFLLSVRTSLQPYTVLNQLKHTYLGLHWCGNLKCITLVNAYFSLCRLKFLVKPSAPLSPNDSWLLTGLFLLSGRYPIQNFQYAYGRWLRICWVMTWISNMKWSSSLVVPDSILRNITEVVWRAGLEEWHIR